VTQRREEHPPPAETNPATGERLPTPDPYTAANRDNYVRNFGAECDMHDEPTSGGLPPA
jgi:hypothetical protein